MSAGVPESISPGCTDAQRIDRWRERLAAGDPWESIETEVLALTGGWPDAVLSLLVTALDLGDAAALA